MRQQFRITFHESADWRLDTFEFAWLLSKHDIDVVAKNDRPMLFVQCTEDDLREFMADVNRIAGPLIFKAVEVSEPGIGYIEI